jgi:carbamate kinase
LITAADIKTAINTLTEANDKIVTIHNNWPQQETLKQAKAETQQSEPVKPATAETTDSINCKKRA